MRSILVGILTEKRNRKNPKSQLSRDTSTHQNRSQTSEKVTDEGER